MQNDDVTLELYTQELYTVRIVFNFTTFVDTAHFALLTAQTILYVKRLSINALRTCTLAAIFV